MTTKKKQILKAAAALFAEKGYKETSMSEVAKLTGVAQGTIFYHYSTKEELFLSILQEFKQDIISEFNTHIEGKQFPCGLDMLEEVVSFYLCVAGSMEDRFLLLHRHDAYELAKVNADCRELLEAIYTCFVDMFEKAVAIGQKDGSIGDVAARKIALILFTLVDGIVRLTTYNLYSPGGLFQDMIEMCRKMLRPNPQQESAL